MKTPRAQAGRISRPQWLAILAIVIAGIASGVAILHLPKGAVVAEGHEHEHEHEHQHGDAQGSADIAPREGPEGQGGIHDHAQAQDKGREQGHEQAHERSPEPVVRLTAAQIQAAGIQVESAGPAEVRATVQLPGEIKLNEDRTAHIVPRVAGVVESVPADLGQRVRKGQVLAILSSVQVSELRSELQAAHKRLALARTTHDREKKLFEDRISAEVDYLQAVQALREAEIARDNATQKLLALGAAGSGSGGLNHYDLRAPFDGMVVEKHLAMGESVKEDANVFTLSDLSSVWAELSVPARDLPLLRVGEQVAVRSSSFDGQASGTVAYVGALIGERTRTAVARVVLPNPALSWRPGLFVTVEVTAAQARVPVAVASGAVHELEGRQVVFAQVAGGFRPVPVRMGRTDGQRTEIVQGLAPGTAYAAGNSFVVKAEIGKASAAHEH